MFGEIVLGPPLLSEPGEWFFDKNYLVYFMYILSSTNENTWQPLDWMVDDRQILMIVFI